MQCSCDICQRVIKELFEQTAQKRFVAPRNKASEEAVEELVEGICAPIKKKQNDMKVIVDKSSETETAPHLWTRKVDIVENTASDSKRYLSIDEPGGELLQSIVMWYVEDIIFWVSFMQEFRGVELSVQLSVVRALTYWR